MKIQLPTSIKVLKKQLKISADLRRKNAQVNDMRKFVKALNSKLESVSKRRIQFVKRDAAYSIYFNEAAITQDPWIMTPGMSQESFNQIKLQILKELGY